MPIKSLPEGAILLQPIFVPEELLGELAANSANKDEVLDLREVAEFLKVAEEDVLKMVQEQNLPARQVGEGWRFLKAAVREWLRSGTSLRRSSKEALLALAGTFKDDPDLDSIVKEAMRLRGRPVIEGE